MNYVNKKFNLNNNIINRDKINVKKGQGQIKKNIDVQSRGSEEKYFMSFCRIFCTL